METSPEPSTNEQIAKIHCPSNGGNPAGCVYRVVRDSQTCMVNGFSYSVIHRLEGKWSGELHKVKRPQSDVVLSEKKAASTKVWYSDEGYWTLRETTAGEDGAATVLNFKLRPVAHGVLSVEVSPEKGGANSDFSKCLLSLTETPYGAQLVGHHWNSGQLMFFQMITVTPQGVMERTSLSYNGGEIEHTCFIRERRVV